MTTLFVIGNNFFKIRSSSFHVSEVDNLKTLNEGASKEREKEEKRRKKKKKKEKRGKEEKKRGREPRKWAPALSGGGASERKIFSGGKSKENFVGRSFFKNVFSNYGLIKIRREK